MSHSHPEYVGFILQHLTKITLRHWDDAMRQLASQSLRKICEIDLATLGPKVVQESAKLLHSPDTVDIHGGLLALSELACAFKTSDSPVLEEQRKTVWFQLRRYSAFCTQE